VYGHIIQSKQPEPGVPIENSKVPVVATLITIQVLLSSPERRQPVFKDPGFTEGFETVPLVNSVTSPEPLGSI
jgi:hypothetical protein